MRMTGTTTTCSRPAGGALFLSRGKPQRAVVDSRHALRRNKLFFFAGFEYLSQLYSPQTLGSWVPTLAERTGDFSVASLNSQLCGARPDGLANPNAVQPMCQAENYLANGNSVNNGQVQNYADTNGVALLNWLPCPTPIRSATSPAITTWCQ